MRHCHGGTVQQVLTPVHVYMHTEQGYKDTACVHTHEHRVYFVAQRQCALEIAAGIGS